jgi:hypothetical protein
MVPNRLSSALAERFDIASILSSSSERLLSVLILNHMPQLRANASPSHKIACVQSASKICDRSQSRTFASAFSFSSPSFHVFFSCSISSSS